MYAGRVLRRVCLIHTESPRSSFSRCYWTVGSFLHPQSQLLVGRQESHVHLSCWRESHVYLSCWKETATSHRNITHVQGFVLRGRVVSYFMRVIICIIVLLKYTLYVISVVMLHGARSDSLQTIQSFVTMHHWYAECPWRQTVSSQPFIIFHYQKLRKTTRWEVVTYQVVRKVFCVLIEVCHLCKCSQESVR